MRCSTVAVLLPLIQATISVQNEPAPTASGIMSEPSNRKATAGSASSAAHSRAIGADSRL